MVVLTIAYYVQSKASPELQFKFHFVRFGYSWWRNPGWKALQSQKGKKHEQSQMQVRHLGSFFQSCVWVKGSYVYHSLFLVAILALLGCLLSILRSFWFFIYLFFSHVIVYLSSAVVFTLFRILPMNFTKDAASSSNVLKDRARAGASLADVDPMEIDRSVSSDWSFLRVTQNDQRLIKKILTICVTVPCISCRHTHTHIYNRSS